VARSGAPPRRRTDRRRFAAWGFRGVAHAARTSPDPDQPTTSLIIEGPYRLTRNPIYLGFALIILGGTFLAGTLWGMFLAPFLVATVTRVIIRAEEQYLQATFAGRYSEYR